MFEVCVKDLIQFCTAVHAILDSFRVGTKCYRYSMNTPLLYNSVVFLYVKKNAVEKCYLYSYKTKEIVPVGHP